MSYVAMMRACIVMPNVVLIYHGVIVDIGVMYMYSFETWSHHLTAPVQRFQLANDWDRASLAAMLPERPVPCELLIHGPILLQYSDRRQVSAWQYRDDPNADPDALPPIQQAVMIKVDIAAWTTINTVCCSGQTATVARIIIGRHYWRLVWTVGHRCT